MEILKGRAQEPGFPDVEVTYLKTDDGQTYFFVEDGTLKNGNIISTPNLKEGIGHAPYTSLGLITPQGDILIPFENKNIKPISNDLLLVERNTPVTQSVIDACQKHSDPLAVTELVASASTIKEQLKSVMGSNSEYIFDNQFSEAALYTADGANLGGNYFSFIGVSSGSYYMCTNVVGDSIIKYDPYAMPQEQTQAEEDTQVDVSQFNEVEQPAVGSSVPQDVPMVPQINVEQSEGVSADNPVINASVDVASGDSIPVQNSEQGISQNNVEVPSSPLIPVIDIPGANDVVNSENVLDNTPVEGDVNQVSQIQSDENMNVGSSVNIPLENNVSEEVNVDDNTNDEVSLNKDIFAEQTASVEVPDNESEEVEDVSMETQDDGIQYEADYSENIEVEDSFEDNESDADSDSVEDSEIYDENDSYVSNDSDTEMEEDSMTEEESNQVVDEDDYFEEEIGNPIIANATNTIRKLLEENRKQRQLIDRQEAEIDTLESSNDILKEENDSKTKEIISLRNSAGKYRSQNNELSRENTRLKATNSRQEEIIEHLKKQNATLKEQVAGISALSNAVAEANTVFAPSQDDVSSYNNGFGYLDEDGDSYQYTKKAA